MTPIDPDAGSEELEGEGLAEILNQVAEDIPADLLRRFHDMFLLRSMLLQLEMHKEGEAGGEGDPQILRLRNRLSSSLEAAHVLEVENELRTTEVPRTAPDDTLIHGRVTDEMARGLEGMVVAIRDERGNPVGIDNVEVGPSGYFAVVVDKESAGKLTEERAERVYLTVMNTKGEVLHRAPTSIKVEKGVEIRHDIPLSTGGMAFADVRPKPEVDSGLKPKGKLKPDAQPEREVKPKPEVRPESGTTPKPEAKPKADAKPKLDVRSRTKVGPKPGADSKPKSDARLKPGKPRLARRGVKPRPT